MGLWQLPLLCLVFLGTRNVGQRTNDSIFARSDFLGFHACLRLSRSPSRFACQPFRGPNGHFRAWRRSNGMRKDGSWFEMADWRVFGNLRVTIMRDAWWTHARSHHIMRRATFPFHSVLFFSFLLSGPHFAFFALLLISCYPGLRSTNRFRLRALRVSIFPSLPFILVLSGRNVLIWLFSSLCLFVFFLWSRTLIDNPSSPMRSTGKHLSIPTPLFSFERSNWFFPFLCPMLLLCALLLLFPLMPLCVLGCITYLANMFVHKKCIYV